jgi:hypothetical protein
MWSFLGMMLLAAMFFVVLRLSDGKGKEDNE